jgi:tetratricopeptide (TPR) repeat protein
LNRAALRFYEEAIAIQPELLAGHRYNAACAAALAGCGRGKDTVRVDEKECARARRQGLDWLCAELEAQGRLLDKDPARTAAEVARQLQHWLVDRDLVGVREPEQLAKLPPEEQKGWGSLWDGVATQAARARDAARRGSPATPVANPPRKEPAPLPPDPVLLAQASYYVRMSQWDDAAAEYAKTDLRVRPLGGDAFGNAALFLIRGDGEGYSRFCEGMIQRVAQTATPFEAYILARSCALASTSPVESLRAVQWANQALASDQFAWYFHALGLAQYRAGQFDQALQSFTNANGKDWRYSDLNWFGLALVHHGLGHPDEARRCLDKGNQWLIREGPPSPERPTQLMPEDWLEAQLLRREAEELLGVKRSP